MIQITSSAANWSAVPKQPLKMTAQGKAERTRSAAVGAVGSGLQGDRERYGVVALIGAIQAPSVEAPAASDRSDSQVGIQQCHGTLIDITLLAVISAF